MLATTTITIMRGTVTGPYDDDLDSDQVVASKVPASILERPVTGGRPASGRTDTQRTHALRVWKPVDIRQDDRVKDERTGAVYSGTSAAPCTTPVGRGSTRAALQRGT